MPNDRSIEHILNTPWLPPPDPHTNTRWVFLHVDVINHSRLFTDDMGDSALLESHNVLNHLREGVVKESIPGFHEDMEWDWAGDGGIYAFRADVSTVPTTEKAVLVAEIIRNALRAANECQGKPALRLEIRIVLTRGWAYYYPEKELRCGSALNRAVKLRVGGDRTSIAITESVLAELQPALHRQFRPADSIESIGEHVYVYVPALKTALEEALNDEAQPDGDPMQAAHFAYRLGALHLGTGDRKDAVDNLRRAESLIKRETSPHRYYHRALSAFYRLWRELAEATTDEMLTVGDKNDRREFLRTLQKTRSLQQKIGVRWQFLHEMEFCIEQLDILARHPVADPSGLTSMQMCLLLERFGYPRRWYGSPIAKRIARIREELKTSQRSRNAGTMDGGCSLCTAVAVSCLVLDDEEDTTAEQMVQWLVGKKPRFCYRSEHVKSRVESGHHSLHYAASVLQALVDADKTHETIPDIVDVFFTFTYDMPGQPLPRNLPEDWLRYLHIPYFDLACYIFSAFARTIIACGDPNNVGLNDRRCDTLRAALAVFADRLIDEARQAGIKNQPERIYAARENLGSFALGLLLEFPRNAIPMFKGVRDLIATVASVDKLDPVTDRKTTVDSNFDRMWRMLDGWLLQWECALVARERGQEPPSVMAELFPPLDVP
ncbi:MAG: hypothetical protein M3P06_02580 [Acidobacteriota bacterium]|nr:hypothetical protein [Acidobacteriota bacterium]